MLLEVNNLSVSYPEFTLHPVSFALDAGEMLTIVGESGSGKTTLARAIACLSEPEAQVSGQVYLNGRELLAMDERARRPLRMKEFALSFQNSAEWLNPSLTLAEHLREVLCRAYRRAAMAARMEELMALVGLETADLERYPRELSGGMVQKFLLANALALNPALVLLDEPTGALDIASSRGITALIQELNRRLGTAFLVITHDMKLAAEHKVPILPVDSEHSAIFQCLTGAYDNPIEKILLTASGGPFRRKTLEELATVTKAQALRHPNWTMGAKITIDSASMMNKGFEMIEAKWLFDVTPDQVQVVVHPQSVIHSMVQFEDGAVIAQLGIPDMKLPIAYAFSFPTRMRSMAPRLDFNQYSTLTFEEPDMERFRNLAFAFEAARQGGNMPCILNAANEVVVAAFLQDRIGFLQMSDVIERTMRKASFIVNPSYEDYVATDTEARRLAAELF